MRVAERIQALPCGLAWLPKQPSHQHWSFGAQDSFCRQQAILRQLSAEDLCCAYPHVSTHQHQQQQRTRTHLQVHMLDTDPRPEPLGPWYLCLLTLNPQP